MKTSFTIRPIAPNDNNIVCTIIRSNLEEFNAALQGTAYYDKDTEAMYEAYQTKHSQYFVATIDNRVVGGCGIKALAGAEEGYCEVQKMYMKPEARGLKIGKALLLKSLEFAQLAGYKHCYIESFPHMEAAIKLYKRNGFIELNQPLGNTNHHACNVWLLKTF